MYRHEKNLYSGIDGTNNCCMFTLPLKGYRNGCPQRNYPFSKSACTLASHLSFNLKFIKQFRTSYKKWRHILTIPFHFEINVLRVFQLAWITMYYAVLKIKGHLVIKHVTYE